MEDKECCNKMGPALFVQNPGVGLETVRVHLEQYIIGGDAFLDRTHCLGENMSMSVQTGSIMSQEVLKGTSTTQSNASCNIYCKCTSVCHSVPQRQTLNSKFYADFLEFLLRPALIRNAHSYWLSSQSRCMVRAHVTWHRSTKASCSAGTGRCWTFFHTLPTCLYDYDLLQKNHHEDKDSGHKTVLNILQSSL